MTSTLTTLELRDHSRRDLLAEMNTQPGSAEDLQLLLEQYAKEKDQQTESFRVWSTATKTDEDMQRRMEILEDSVRQLTEIVSTLLEMKSAQTS